MWKKGNPPRLWVEFILVQSLWKTVWRYLKKVNRELLYDPAIPLLGIYSDKIFTKKDTCISMFIAALFTIAKTWKQPKCPLTDEWIKIWYIYTMEYYSTIKKNKIMPFCSNTGRTWDSHTKWSKSERQIPYHLLVESNIWSKWSYLQNRNRLTDMENRLVFAKVEGGGSGMDWKVGVNRCKLLHLEWISNEILLYSTENYIWSLVMEDIMEKKKKE